MRGRDDVAQPLRDTGVFCYPESEAEKMQMTGKTVHPAKIDKTMQRTSKR
jgi:hypothetical protein